MFKNPWLDHVHIWGGGRREVLRVNRMNGNMQPWGVGGEVNLEKVPETWKVRDSKDSKGRNLDEMPKSRERELVESTSSGKTGHQVDG